MKSRDLGDLMREYGRHLETRMTPLDPEDVSVHRARPRPEAVRRSRMGAWSVVTVALVTVVAGAALYLAPASGLEIIDAGVTAVYSGNAERAAQLFELGDRTDDEIGVESAYQAAIGGRLTLNCTPITDSVFQCNAPYHNAMTDAIGYVDSPGDTFNVVVEDGVITEFDFPEHYFIAISMGTFLATEGRFDGYYDCQWPGPFSVSCAAIQLENLEAWAVWYGTDDPVPMVESALKSWYGGDCVGALRLIEEEEPGADPCESSGVPSQTIQYESLLGADVSVEGCEEIGSPTHLEMASLSCEVHYSNVMNIAVGEPPSVTVRDFDVLSHSVVRTSDGALPWYSADYPEDIELRESFRTFAEDGELAEAYANAACGTARTAECATLILDNLDAWAVWYESNG